MLILLTGASGFLGRAILHNLLGRGHRVRALDLNRASWDHHAADGRLEDLEGDPRVELLFGDVAEYPVVAAAVAGCDAVITAHAYFNGSGAGGAGSEAWRAQLEHGGERGRELRPVEPMEKVNDSLPWLVMIKGLWNILDAARWAGTTRVVHVSSCATIWPGGPSSPGSGSRRFTSDARSQEGDSYGVSKRLQEEMCRAFYDSHGLPIIILRPDGIFDSRLGLWGHPRGERPPAQDADPEAL